MDPRNATMESANPGRKQHQLRLARLPTTLLSPVHRHSSRLYSQKVPHPTENEVPRHRFLHSRLRTNRPKSPLPFRITRNESTIPIWTAKRRGRRRDALPHTYYLPRTHREGPRQCSIKGATPKCIRRE